MHICDHYRRGTIGLSFELFPPKTPAGCEALLKHVGHLMMFQPNYITCTYGAGGSTRQKTLQVVERVKEEFQIPVASHLTCVGSTTEELRTYLADAHRRNVDYFVALRGDPPQGETQFCPVEGGLRYANELVALIRADFPEFGIAVGGYPETHQEAPSAKIDLENLKRKVAAGADIVITQLFYDNNDYFSFRDRCAAIGLEVPLVPGILPVTSLAQVERITSLCGAKLPPDFLANLQRYQDDADEQFRIGIDHAIHQTQGLIDAEVAGLHFYVLNNSQATSSVLTAIRER